MTRLLALPGSEYIAGPLATLTGAEPARATFHRFPDEESYVRIDSDVAGQTLMLIASLDRPDTKVLPLMFAAATGRDLGATGVGLIAPYLAYMRQDRRFKPGEAVTAPLFARFLSSVADWLVTVDPHLHRVHDLEDIYGIPARVVHAGPAIAQWIRAHVADPLLIGPDEESVQWVGGIAREIGAPHIVLKKVRRGDADVSVSLPDMARWRDATPVLVDDIISTAQTMIQACEKLRGAGMKPPVCIGVHAIFAGHAHADLCAVAARIVTCNTIAHETNGIDVTALLAQAAAEFIR